MPRVFISHASRDRALVDQFIDTVLRLGCGLGADQIFYSSGADTGVPGGSNLNAYIRGEVEEADLVLAIITPSFSASPYCVAELGAAWSRTGALFPLAARGATLGNMGGVLTGILVRYLDDPEALDGLKDRIDEAVNRSSSRTWGRYRDQWLRLAGPLLDAVSRGGRGVPTSTAACSREERHMELFWTDGSGKVFYRWWHEERGWSDVDEWDDPAALYVAAVSRAPGDQLLFGVADDGRVWMRKWRRDSRGWMTAGSPEILPGRAFGPLTAVSRAEWHVELSARTAAGNQCHIWRHDHNWTDWTESWTRR